MVVDGTVDPSAQIRIPLATVNRHGLVARRHRARANQDLQVMAEQLSAAGVPVLMADVRATCRAVPAGESNDKVTQRARRHR